MDNKKYKLYQKWWFWCCLLLITIIICFTLILINVKSSISGMALQIQDIYNDATLYTSAGDNALILELRHITENDINNSIYTNIFQVIRNNASDLLSSYNKLIIISYVDSNEKENAEIVHSTYSMPELKESHTQIYVDQEYLQTSITNSIVNMFTNY